MKRTLSLVSYESSDDNAESVPDAPCKATVSRRKLPKLSPSLTVPVPIDNPALHQGRIRTTPHVDGQFSAFVYVPVALKKTSALRTLLEKAIRLAKEAEPRLMCDWQDNSGTHTLHISLTRPIYLRHYQREDLKRAVKAAAHSIWPFSASFSCFSSFTNDERTRAFLGVEVGAGHREMELLSKAIEPTLKLLHQESFYSEPRFHASIAWALLAATAKSSAAASRSPSPDADMASFPSVITSFPSSFIPNINKQFGQLLSDTKIGSYEVDCICVKIGKEVSSWPLGME